MPAHVDSSHRIRIDMPAAACQRLFTPAGEELWVDGWAPNYLQPSDGRTAPGMVFTTGEGAAHTIWMLADFDTTTRLHARYVRTTPGSRCGVVTVDCLPDGAQSTLVEVRYTMTALTPQGERDLQAFEGAAYVAMIEGWKAEIDARLPALRGAEIR